MANDFTRAAKQVDQLGEAIERSVDDEIGDVMDDITDAARRNLVTGSSRQVVTGTLQSSIEHNTFGKSGVAIGDVVDPDAYSAHETRAAAPHAPYVEYGTGTSQRGTPLSGRTFKSPGTPPTGHIHEWIEDKGVRPKNPKFVNPDGSTNTYALARAIAEHIWKYGNKAHPFMRPAWTTHRASLSSAHRRGVRQALRQTF